MAVAEPARRPRRVVGSAKPRLSPPEPLRTGERQFSALASSLGQPLWPWQRHAARFLTARGPSGWLYPEVAVVVARQNGKTTLLAPLIVGRLLLGHRIIHTAQDADLPRETHQYVAELLERHYPDRLGRGAIRYANGQEHIKTKRGGLYRIVPPSTGKARGKPNDLVIIDEARELEDDRFIAAANPSTIARQMSQTVYLSNAGTDLSDVLNSLRKRSGADPSLAYLEWSAAPGRQPDELAGWLESNPSIGHNPWLLDNLQRTYRSYLLADKMDVWEREHLCRWTVGASARLVTAEEWSAQAMLPERPEPPVRTALGVKMDLSGERLSAVLAWRDDDDTIGLDVVMDVTGDPIDVDVLGPDLRRLQSRLRVRMVGYDPYTDADLARHFGKAEAITGRDYAAATERFTRTVAQRRFCVFDPGAIIADDLAVTTRRAATNGTSIAVKAGPEVTNTAAEAAIRAAWIASAPTPRPVP